MAATHTNARANLATSDRRLAQQLADSGDLRVSVSLILASGGDMRIWPDPITGRNRYGTKTSPAPDEISFSSTTASNISVEGFAAASQALQRLFGTGGETAVAPDQWFDEVRDGIANLLGAPGSKVILAASGTDAELLTLGLATALSTRPITNVFIAPDETGNGIPLAAAGRHFSDMTALAQMVAEGQPIEGFAQGHVDVRTVAIRDETGKPREPHAIDRDVAMTIEQELQRGRDVLLHVLDASKTGLTGVTRQAARDLAAVAPGRVRVVIDACQLRCQLSQLRRDLADGFMVNVTGSKFAAGPAFAGALLLPAGIADEITLRTSLAAGLSDYTAALDWPASLRDQLELSFKSEANIGLGLRWVAALDNITRYASIGEIAQTQIIDHFAAQVRARAIDVEGLALHPDDRNEHFASRSIVPMTVLTKDRAYAPLAEAHRIRLALQDPAEGAVCHVGQAVRVGPRTVLRVSASARDVADVAARMATGQSLEHAFQPIATNLDAFFAKWSKIARDTWTA
jgi:hypothetical protein